MSLVAGHASKLAATEQSFRALFYEQLAQTRAEWGPVINAIAMTMPTPGLAQVNHRWLGPVPQMTKWAGDRRIGKLGAEGFTIENYDWSNGFEIDKPSLRRDQLGLYSPKIRELAMMGYLHQLTILIDLLNGGFTGLGYDAVTFFNDSHPNGWDNYTNELFDADAYKAAVTRLKGVTNSDGEPLRLRPTHLIVGNDLEWTAREVLESERLASGATNITRGTAQLIVEPRITAKYWFVADLSRPVKPLILQIEEDINESMQTNAESDDVFHRNKHNYGAQWAGGAGYGLPELIQGSDGSGS